MPHAKHAGVCAFTYRRWRWATLTARPRRRKVSATARSVRPTCSCAPRRWLALCRPRGFAGQDQGPLGESGRTRGAAGRRHARPAGSRFGLHPDADGVDCVALFYVAREGAGRRGRTRAARAGRGPAAVPASAAPALHCRCCRARPPASCCGAGSPNWCRRTARGCHERASPPTAGADRAPWRRVHGHAGARTGQCARRCDWSMRWRRQSLRPAPIRISVLHLRSSCKVFCAGADLALMHESISNARRAGTHAGAGAPPAATGRAPGSGAAGDAGRDRRRGAGRRIRNGAGLRPAHCRARSAHRLAGSRTRPACRAPAARSA